MRIDFSRYYDDSSKLRCIYLTSRIHRKLMLAVNLTLKLPLGVIAKDENSVYIVPFGVWTWKRERFSIFGLNLLFLGFHVLIDNEAQR